MNIRNANNVNAAPAVVNQLVLNTLRGAESATAHIVRTAKSLRIVVAAMEPTVGIMTGLSTAQSVRYAAAECVNMV